MEEASPHLDQSQLSGAHFELFVKEVAERFSELRRIGNLFGEHRRRLAAIREIGSSDEERALDWRNACDFMSLKIIEGNEIGLVQLDPASYPILEDSWLQRVKQ